MLLLARRKHHESKTLLCASTCIWKNDNRKIEKFPLFSARRMLSSSNSSFNKSSDNNNKKAGIAPIKRMELKKTLTHRFTVPFNAKLFESLNLSTFSVGELTKAFERLDLDKDGVLNVNDIVVSFGNEMGNEFIEHYAPPSSSSSSSSSVEISLAHFVNHTTRMAEKIDSRVWPIAASMFLTGTAVGIVVPVLPMFVQQTLSGNGADFGMVIGAFAVTKMLGNVPSAVLADAFGRKPLLISGMFLVSIGMGSMVFATSLDHVLLSRLITGFGVSSFTTGSTLYLADISTPFNRARSMAPTLAAFSAGAAIGPALGGVLADTIGLQKCFLLTGSGFFCLALFNHLILTETLPSTMRVRRSVKEAFGSTLESWRFLLTDDVRLRNIFLVNCLYWVAMSGAQTTLLPLILTEKGYSASEVGLVFAVMSSVFVFGSTPAGWLADKVGYSSVIVSSCGMIASGVFLFPGFHYGGVQYEFPLLALALWSLGGTLLGTTPTAYVTALASQRNRSQALALHRTMGDVGLLIGSLSSGFLADHTSLNHAMQGNALLLTATTAWFARNNWRK